MAVLEKNPDGAELLSPNIKRTTTTSANPAVHSIMEKRGAALRCCSARNSYLFIAAVFSLSQSGRGKSICPLLIAPVN